MADAVIGALRVVMGADTTAFETAMKTTETRLKSMGSSLMKTAALAAASFAAIGAGVAYAVKSALGEAEKLGDVALQLGMTTEQLTELKHAAETSGASLEALTIGMKTLARSMAAAAADSRSAMAESFKAIGVSVLDAQGNLRSARDVMLDFAEKMKGMRDGAGKTALVMQVFGEQGTQLVRMLNEGKAGIASMSQEARELGIVIGQDTVEAAKRFNSNLDNIHKAQKAMTLQLTAKLAPALESISHRFLEFAKDADGAASVAEKLANAFRYVITLAERLSSIMQVAKLSVSSFWDEAGNQTSMSEYIKRVTEGYEKIRDAYDRNIARLTYGDDMAKALGFDAIAKHANKAADDLDKVAAPIGGAIKRLREIFNFQFSDPFAGVATKMDLLNDAFKRGIIPVWEYRTMLRQLYVEDMAQLRTAAKTTLEDTLANGAISAAEKMKALDAAVRAGTLGFVEYRAKVKAVLEEARKFDGLALSVNVFASEAEKAFSDFASGSEMNFKKMSASILAEIAKIIFKLQVLRPLFGDGTASNAGLIGNLLNGQGLQGFADGGRPPVNQPSWVGERGPEIFIPDTAGTIVPNHMLGKGDRGQAPAINLSIDARNSTPDAVSELKRSLPALILETVQEARSRSVLP